MKKKKQTKIKQSIKSNGDSKSYQTSIHLQYK